MAARRRWTEFSFDVPTAGIYAVFGIYIYCVSRIIFSFGLTHTDAPEVLLTPIVLGRGLHWWISACNLLWALYFAARLLDLATARGSAKKSDALLLLLGIAGLLWLEAGLPLVFEVMAGFQR